MGTVVVQQLFLICRFKYRKSSKSRILSAVNCWAKVYLKLALKSLSFGDVAFTKDFFVTFPFFRGKILWEPDVTKTNRRNLENLEGLPISCKWLENLQPTTLILFLAFVELISSCAFIQLPHQNFNITVLDILLKKSQQMNKKPHNHRSVIWNTPTYKQTFPEKHYTILLILEYYNILFFCSICTTKKLSPQSLLTH